MYKIVPVYTIDPALVMSYWQDLGDADLIKYRLGDISAPCLSDCVDMTRNFLRSMYMVYDSEDRLVCEFTLMNFSGRSAQIHFSMHPSNTTRQNLTLGRMCTDAPIYTWTAPDRPDESYLTSIFGLTPLPNRPACLFVLKTGMKKLGVIPDGTRHLGRVCDGMITLKTKEAQDGK